MKDILKKYIEQFIGYDGITVKSYTFNGSNCEVIYSEELTVTVEKININIWQMFEFAVSENNNLKKLN